MHWCAHKTATLMSIQHTVPCHAFKKHDFYTMIGEKNNRSAYLLILMRSGLFKMQISSNKTRVPTLFEH